jgi:hypothetical protein
MRPFTPGPHFFDHSGRAPKPIGVLNMTEADKIAFVVALLIILAAVSFALGILFRRRPALLETTAKPIGFVSF